MNKRSLGTLCSAILLCGAVASAAGLGTVQRGAVVADNVAAQLRGGCSETSVDSCNTINCNGQSFFTYGDTSYDIRGDLTGEVICDGYPYACCGGPSGQTFCGK